LAETEGALLSVLQQQSRVSSVWSLMPPVAVESIGTLTLYSYSEATSWYELESRFHREDINRAKERAEGMNSIEFHAI
jgi:hypothetical protein